MRENSINEGQTGSLRIEVDRRTHGFTKWLVGGVMPDMKVRVIQSLLTANPFCRIKAKQLGKKFYCMRISMGEQSRERNARLDRQGSNVILCLGGVLK